MSKVIRSVKNVTKGYSSVQVKVREATSNDAWGPTGTQMSEIAQLTYNSSTDFYEIMDMLDKRLNDKGKNWRHVLKALKVLDYVLHEGAELVVTWAKQNIYIIKTLREFQYEDEDGRDVGHNVRVAAKELTSLVLDEERLKAERTDRKSWKSRVTGLDEYGPPPEGHREHREPRERNTRPPRRQRDDEEDAEYKLALEASRYQEEEDRKKRESRHGGGFDSDDDDLAKAIKLSKEEEERRRRELEESNSTSLFDDDLLPTPQQQPNPTGFNQGYQQGSAVDFLANPIDQNQMPQPTGYMQTNMYTGFQSQPTGYQNGFGTGYGAQQPTFDPYGQQSMQQGMQSFQQQQPQQQQPQQTTGYNPYAQQQQAQSPIAQDPNLQPGSNNPWATTNSQMALKPMPTGSNNPFAQQATRPQTFKAPSMPSLSSLPEQKTLASFQPQPSSFASPPLQFQQNPQLQPQRELTDHESRLNTLLATGDGMDTFGNTGQLRIPAQHTAPGTFVNSAGAGLNRINADATGNNPFMRTQFTGMPSVSYGGQQMPAATGPAGMNGFGAGGQNNPFAARPQQQQPQQQQSHQGGDLIQF